MAYRNTFFRWLFLYSLTFGLTYVLKLFTYLCPETGQPASVFWYQAQGTCVLVLLAFHSLSAAREKTAGFYGT